MTLAEATERAIRKYPIYYEDDPASGIKKDCPLERRRKEGLIEQYIKRLLDESTREGRSGEESL